MVTTSRSPGMTPSSIRLLSRSGDTTTSTEVVITIAEEDQDLPAERTSEAEDPPERARSELVVANRVVPAERAKARPVPGSSIHCASGCVVVVYRSGQHHEPPGCSPGGVSGGEARGAVSAGAASAAAAVAALLGRGLLGADFLAAFFAAVFFVDLDADFAGAGFLVALAFLARGLLRARPSWPRWSSSSPAFLVAAFFGAGLLAALAFLVALWRSSWSRPSWSRPSSVTFFAGPLRGGAAFFADFLAVALRAVALVACLRSASSRPPWPWSASPRQRTSWPQPWPSSPSPSWRGGRSAARRTTSPSQRSAVLAQDPVHESVRPTCGVGDVADAVTTLVALLQVCRELVASRPHDPGALLDLGHCSLLPEDGRCP